MEEIHGGWLTKSPPEWKPGSAWKLFKSKWRKRYFVLYVPPSSVTASCTNRQGSTRTRGGVGSGQKSSSSAPGPLLCYYDNDRQDRQYGKIELRRCDKLLTSTDCSVVASDIRFLFALRMRTDSGCSGKTASGDSCADSNVRTYFLSADSEKAMTAWINCLSTVLRNYGIYDPIDLTPLNPISSDHYLQQLPQHASVSLHATASFQQPRSEPFKVKAKRRCTLFTSRNQSNETHNKYLSKPTAATLDKRISQSNSPSSPLSSGTMKRQSKSIDYISNIGRSEAESDDPRRRQKSQFDLDNDQFENNTSASASTASLRSRFRQSFLSIFSNPPSTLQTPSTSPVATPIDEDYDSDNRSAVPPPLPRRRLPSDSLSLDDGLDTLSSSASHIEQTSFPMPAVDPTPGHPLRWLKELSSAPKSASAYVGWTNHPLATVKATVANNVPDIRSVPPTPSTSDNTRQAEPLLGRRFPPNPPKAAASERGTWEQLKLPMKTKKGGSQATFESTGNSRESIAESHHSTDDSGEYNSDYEHPPHAYPQEFGSHTNYRRSNLTEDSFDLTRDDEQGESDIMASGRRQIRYYDQANNIDRIYDVPRFLLAANETSRWDTTSSLTTDSAIVRRSFVSSDGGLTDDDLYDYVVDSGGQSSAVDMSATGGTEITSDKNHSVDAQTLTRRKQRPVGQGSEEDDDDIYDYPIFEVSVQQSALLDSETHLVPAPAVKRLGPDGQQALGTDESLGEFEDHYDYLQLRPIRNSADATDNQKSGSNPTLAADDTTGVSKTEITGMTVNDDDDDDDAYDYPPIAKAVGVTQALTPEDQGESSEERSTTGFEGETQTNSDTVSCGPLSAGEGLISRCCDDVVTMSMTNCSVSENQNESEETSGSSNSTVSSPFNKINDALPATLLLRQNAPNLMGESLARYRETIEFMPNASSGTSVTSLEPVDIRSAAIRRKSTSSRKVGPPVAAKPPAEVRQRFMMKRSADNLLSDGRDELIGRPVARSHTFHTISVRICDGNDFTTSSNQCHLSPPEVPHNLVAERKKQIFML